MNTAIDTTLPPPANHILAATTDISLAILRSMCGHIGLELIIQGKDDIPEDYPAFTIMQYSRQMTDWEKKINDEIFLKHFN